MTAKRALGVTVVAGLLAILAYALGLFGTRPPYNATVTIDEESANSCKITVDPKWSGKPNSVWAHTGPPDTITWKLGTTTSGDHTITFLGGKSPVGQAVVPLPPGKTYAIVGVPFYCTLPLAACNYPYTVKGCTGNNPYIGVHISH
jgi:hypothetical protein